VNKMPQFSVIIPSYNHARYISQAISSVLAQSLSDLELIVIDDGSSDNTLSVIQAFHDQRLKIYAQANQGAHAAINRGIQIATGEYIAILNSDDSYENQRLEKIFQIFTSHPEAGLVGSYINIIDADGHSLGIKQGYKNFNPWPLSLPEKSIRHGQNLQKALVTENYLATTSNFVFSKKTFEAIGPFRRLRYAHDWDFALRVANQLPLFLIEEPLINYRIHSSNTISENQVAMVFEIAWCLAVHLPRHSFQPGGFNLLSPADVEELLHSVFLFGCEKTLIAMLLQGLSANESLAESLLDVQNPLRQKYIEFIQQELQTKVSTNLPNPENKKFLPNLWKKIGELF